MIMPNDVVRVGDPEACGRLVDVQETATFACEHDQVVLNDVVLFVAVFNENGQAHDVVGNVVFYRQVVCGMDSRCAVERVVDAAATNIQRRSRMSICPSALYPG